MGFAICFGLVTFLATGVLLYLRSRPDGVPIRQVWADWAAGVPWRDAPIAVAAGGLAFVAGLLLMKPPPGPLPGLLGLVFLLGLALFFRAWAREFLVLMSLSDDDLPGRFDKPIWAAVLVVLPPAGLLLFRSYREARWPEAAAKPEPARDLR